MRTASAASSARMYSPMFRTPSLLLIHVLEEATGEGGGGGTIGGGPSVRRGPPRVNPAKKNRNKQILVKTSNPGRNPSYPRSKPVSSTGFASFDRGFSEAHRVCGVKSADVFFDV